METTTETTTTTETAHIRMGLLPPNLAGLAKLASKDNPRYATSGPRLQLRPDGYRVDVTDCKRVLSVEGAYPNDPANYPEIPALTAAPNSGTSAVVGAKDWTEAFKLAPKGRKISSKPILENIGVVIGDKQTTFGATDLETANAKTALNIEGHYPPVEQIKPPCNTAPTVSISFDPVLLAELLSVMASFTTEGSKHVTLELYQPKRNAKTGKDEYGLIFLRAENNGQKAAGALVPLYPDR